MIKTNFIAIIDFHVIKLSHSEIIDDQRID
jgi:hypothetical protein